MAKTKIFFFVLGILLATLSQAANQTITIIPSYNTAQYDAIIANIYQTTLNNSDASMAQRIAAASSVFLGKPYLLGALGEGQNGQFDQAPLYRTDDFDCMTYVETIMALTEANNLTEFQQIIKKIRYENGDVAYLKRNHFTSVDWNPNNQKLGYIENITNLLGAPIQVASVLIDKPNWYRQKQIKDLRFIRPISSIQAKQLLQQWHQAKVTAVKSRVDYIPLSALFKMNGKQIKPQQAIFDRIPSGAIVELVNKNSNTKNKVGTDLNIMHLGLAIRTDQGLMFREASEVHDKVIDVPLVTYLQRRYMYGGNPDDQGIHVELIINPNVTA